MPMSQAFRVEGLHGPNLQLLSKENLNGVGGAGSHWKLL